MGLRVDEPASDLREIDRFEGGVGWIAHPDERMQRASFALELDGDVWVIDPVDAAPLDDLLASLGEVAGVVLTLERHYRDADAVASRHDVPIAAPLWFPDVNEDLTQPVVALEDVFEPTTVTVRPVVRTPLWREVAVYVHEHDLLWVPEAVGTAPYFRAGTERLGVHPLLRPWPPRRALGDLEPARIQVGHGPGVTTSASEALHDALEGARRRMPRLLAETVRSVVL